MQQAITTRGGNHANSGRHVALLTPTVQAVSAAPTVEMTPSMLAWPQLALPIGRSSQDGQLAAPGLCSYIASNCGGALGRVFLVDVSQGFLHGNPALSRISEDGEDGESDLGVLAKSVTRDSLGSPADPPPVQEMDELEPISSDGLPVRWWVAMAEEQTALGGAPPNIGKRMVLVPQEAMLGEGSYGVVWRARHRDTGTVYAVKNVRTQRQGNMPSVAQRDATSRITCGFGRTLALYGSSSCTTSRTWGSTRWSWSSAPTVTYWTACGRRRPRPCGALTALTARLRSP